jgi:hypothetical protein
VSPTPRTQRSAGRGVFWGRGDASLSLSMTTVFRKAVIPSASEKRSQIEHTFLRVSS